jgi:hypothetical protein
MAIRVCVAGATGWTGRAPGRGALCDTEDRQIDPRSPTQRSRNIRTVSSALDQLARNLRIGVTLCRALDNVRTPHLLLFAPMAVASAH